MQNKIPPFNESLGYDDVTIVARCTPSGPGALAVIRLSGANACRIAQAMGQFQKTRNIETVASHSIVHGHVHDAAGKKIDEVLFLVMRAPRTFTGEDVVEICCHNNPFLIETIIDIALVYGARLATPGEFSKRAVLHGKLSVLDAEAINELAYAATPQARLQALEQLDGSLTRWAASVEHLLLKALAYCESSFEFLDEELTFDHVIKEAVEEVQAQLQKITAQNASQKAVREGIRIAFIGTVNAGKSSLFNAILCQKRAIVTAVPGTTRDTLEAGITTSSCYLTIVDTAGIRQTDDLIEREGIERSYQEADKADIICLLYDSTRQLTIEEENVYKEIVSNYKEKIIVSATKAEGLFQSVTRPHWAPESIPFLITSINDDSLRVTFQELLFHKAEHLCSGQAAGFLINKRQAHLLVQTKSAVATVTTFFKDPYPYELIAVHLKDALACLTELSGKTISEKGMDAVFREFCVGK